MSAEREEMLRTAMQRHQAGKLDEAEGLYRTILRQNRSDADALNLLGVLHRQRGQLVEAAELLRKAVRARPDFAAIHNNLGNVLKEQKELDEAAAAYREAVRLDPNLAEAHNNLGNVLRDLGELAEAETALRTAIGLRKNWAEALNNLALVLKEQKRMGEAASAVSEAVRLRPNLAEAHNTLGTILKYQGRIGDALAAFQTAIQLRPAYAEAFSNLGNLMRLDKRLPEAEAALRESLRLRPTYVDAMNNLGAVLAEVGRVDEAIEQYRRAIALEADDADAHNNLGSALRDQGSHMEAIAEYRRALECEGDHALAAANLAGAVCVEPSYDAGAILKMHREWAKVHAEPLYPRNQEYRNDRDAHRRLRIGYVSPDFWNHSVARFLLPIFDHHDHQQFHITCYSDVAKPDVVTDKLKVNADQWRSVVGVQDLELAEMIRADEIDILVDLALHSAGNRMLVFARRPAPVQVSYLGYPGTTGLTTMDWRLTDPYLDPAGTDENYSERSMRLKSYWCYRAPADAPVVNELPAKQCGFVTFGCLNNFNKTTDACLMTWAQLLASIPRSRLILHSKPGSHRQRVRKMFGEVGVGEERVEFVESGPLQEFLGHYGRIDIALDPFPYNGGTTTCDALWMGMPVVSLAGDVAVRRSGASILNQVGLGELVAGSREEYLQIAKSLAENLSKLAELRRGMRERMRTSPLMDEAGCTVELERAYRQMWREWAGKT